MLEYIRENNPCPFIEVLAVIEYSQGVTRKKAREYLDILLCLKLVETKEGKVYVKK